MNNTNGERERPGVRRALTSTSSSQAQVKQQPTAPSNVVSKSFSNVATLFPAAPPQTRERRAWLGRVGKILGYVLPQLIQTREFCVHKQKLRGKLCISSLDCDREFYRVKEGQFFELRKANFLRKDFHNPLATSSLLDLLFPKLALKSYTRYLGMNPTNTRAAGDR